MANIMGIIGNDIYNIYIYIHIRLYTYTLYIYTHIHTHTVYRMSQATYGFDHGIICHWVSIKNNLENHGRDTTN